MPLIQLGAYGNIFGSEKDLKIDRSFEFASKDAIIITCTHMSAHTAKSLRELVEYYYNQPFVNLHWTYKLFYMDGTFELTLIQNDTSFAIQKLMRMFLEQYIYV